MTVVPGVAWGAVHGTTAWIAAAACLVAVVPAGLRWLRVAQREHYVTDATSRFALRWWRSSAVNLALIVVAAAGLVLCARWPLFAVLPAVVSVIGPVGLGIRGRSSPLVFTRRLRVLAAVATVWELAVFGVGAAIGAPALLGAAAVLATPALVDLSCACTAPFERRLAQRFVVTATERLGRIAPTVVAITGSYGKTSTKNHLAHLLLGSRSAVASPASFNNRAGLARAVNENLTEGTEVFVAEMGTYGPGEIAELCRWCPPDISVITAIGPVHLERFGTEERIAEAKAEITEDVSVVALNVDDPRLAALADRLAAREGTTVLRCSAVDLLADAYVGEGPGGLTLSLAGTRIAEDLHPAGSVRPTNLACALAVASHLGVTPDLLAARVGDLPSVPNRLVPGTVPSGVVVLDDTFNANPAGVSAALGLLAEVPGATKRVVVTPGMVELGSRQREENERFSRAAVAVADDLVIVGRTNRRALAAGAGEHPVVTVRTREEAVAWVRSHLQAGDAVLYENDLPDHYP
jgi:UDP-N-acetylmuramoyl-tripeptide--D-alanyl-D-alanine ligase